MAILANMKVVHKDSLNQITFLDERYYQSEASGLYQPSVNTILDVYPKGYGFLQWLKDIGSNSDEVLKRAGEQGTHIHDAIEGFLRGEEVRWLGSEIKEGTESRENYTLEEWVMLLRFLDFYKTWKPITIAIEVSLVDDELGYGGTLDYVCKIPAFPNDIWYIDWKSGGSIYKGNKIQGATYIKIWNKLNPTMPITRGGCMHLRAMTRGADKTGKQIQGEGWKLEELENIDHLFELFKHAQAIWREENPNPKPKNVIYPDRFSLDILKAEEEVK